MSSGFYRWAVVAMLWLVCLFNYADRQAIFSVFTPLKQEMNLSDVQLGIIGGAFAWVYAVVMPFAGLVGDRFSRKGLILGGLVFWSAITLATGLAQNYWQLVLCRGLEGLGEAFYFPASMSLISDYHGGGTRSRAMGLHQSSVYAGTVAGGTVAGLLADHAGWRSGFFLFGGLGVLLALVLVAVLREPARGQADGRRAGEVRPGPVLADLRAVLGTPGVLALVGVFVGANFVAMVFLTWMPSYLHRTFGMSLSLAGFSGTAYLQAASVLGVLAGGVLADRWARRRAGGRMLAQAVGLFVGVPFLVLTGWTLSAPVLVLGLVGFGFGKGLYDANIWASLYDVVEVRHRATALGLANCIGWLGGSLAPIAVAAASVRFGMGACLAATSAIYLVLALGLCAVVRARRRGAPTLAPVFTKENVHA